MGMGLWVFDIFMEGIVFIFKVIYCILFFPIYLLWYTIRSIISRSSPKPVKIASHGRYKPPRRKLSEEEIEWLYLCYGVDDDDD